MSMSGGRLHHPFDFGTYPRLLNRALRARLLSRDEYVILVGLYARANRETWLASVTLDQLGDLIAWEKSEDYLYRLLDALKRKAWIEYPTTPGKKQHVYAIRLLWDRPERSEDGPRIENAPSPSTAAAEDGSSADVPPAALSNESEDEGGRTTAAGPSTEPSGPRIEDSSNADTERDSRSVGDEPVRAPRDVREKTNPSSKEKFKDQRLGSSDHRTVEGEGTAETNDDRFLDALGFRPNGDGPAVSADEDGGLVWRDEPMEGEAGFLADAQALVDVGLAAWEDS